MPHPAGGFTASRAPVTTPEQQPENQLPAEGSARPFRGPVPAVGDPACRAPRCQPWRKAASPEFPGGRYAPAIQRTLAQTPQVVVLKRQQPAAVIGNRPVRRPADGIVLQAETATHKQKPNQEMRVGGAAPGGLLAAFRAVAYVVAETPPSAMSEMESTARTRPTTRILLSRSLSNSRASPTVTAGNSDVSTAATAREPACAASR